MSSQHGDPRRSGSCAPPGPCRSCASVVRLRLVDLVLLGLTLLLELLRHFDDLVRTELRRAGVGIDALDILDGNVLEVVTKRHALGVGRVARRQLVPMWEKGRQERRRESIDAVRQGERAQRGGMEHLADDVMT